MTRTDLETMGFDFKMGYAVMDNPDDDANYVRTIQIMEYTVKFNPKDPEDTLIITKL